MAVHVPLLEEYQNVHAPKALMAWSVKPMKVILLVLKPWKNYWNDMCISIIEYNYIHFWCLTGYFQTDYDKLCSENGDLPITDIRTCKVAAKKLLLNDPETGLFGPNWPTGCLVVRGILRRGRIAGDFVIPSPKVYFNQYSSESRNKDARQICSIKSKR